MPKINRPLDFKNRKRCSFCNIEYQVWVLHPEFGLIKGITRLPTGLHRCIGCGARADLNYLEQKKLTG